MEPSPITAEIKFQPQIVDKARLAVAGMAHSTEDARILLDMLGLVEDPVRFPSWDVGDRGTRRPPATPAAAPLPAYGYGALVPLPPVSQRPVERIEE